MKWRVNTYQYKCIDQYINIDGCPPDGVSPLRLSPVRLAQFNFLGVGGEAEVFADIEPTLQDPTAPPRSCPWEAKVWNKWTWELGKTGSQAMGSLDYC